MCAFPLLDDDEIAPVTVLNADSDVPCILLGEHAGTAVPRKLENLGIDPAHFKEHFAHDIGIRDVLESLAARMKAPAILGNYSRLVVDVNRALDHPTAFPRTGDDYVIHGNLDLSDEDKAARQKAIYDPFDSSVREITDRFLEAGQIPLFISIHSFTSQFFNHKRPWEVGFLWVDDRRGTEAVKPYFEKKGFTVGDNEPYDARMLRGTMLNKHADDRRLPSILFEIRNDMIDTGDKAATWADMISEAVGEFLGDETLHSFYDGERREIDHALSQEYFQQLTEKAKTGEHNG